MATYRASGRLGEMLALFLFLKITQKNICRLRTFNKISIGKGAQVHDNSAGFWHWGRNIRGIRQEGDTLEPFRGRLRRSKVKKIKTVAIDIICNFCRFMQFLHLVHAIFALTLFGYCPVFLMDIQILIRE